MQTRRIYDGLCNGYVVFEKLFRDTVLMALYRQTNYIEYPPAELSREEFSAKLRAAADERMRKRNCNQ